VYRTAITATDGLRRLENGGWGASPPFTMRENFTLYN